LCQLFLLRVEVLEMPNGAWTAAPAEWIRGRGGMDAAGRGRRRPGVSKQDVCERKASPVAPVIKKSLAFAKLFFILEFCLWQNSIDWILWGLRRSLYMCFTVCVAGALMAG